MKKERRFARTYLEKYWRKLKNNVQYLRFRYSDFLVMILAWYRRENIRPKLFSNIPENCRKNNFPRERNKNPPFCAIQKKFNFSTKYTITHIEVSTFQTFSNLLPRENSKSENKTVDSFSARLQDKYKYNRLHIFTVILTISLHLVAQCERIIIAKPKWKIHHSLYLSTDNKTITACKIKNSKHAHN